MDTGFWLPSLAFESGSLPATVLPGEPSIAAWVSGFFAARAGFPVIPQAPSVRKGQLDQLNPSLAWVIREMDLR